MNYIHAVQTESSRSGHGIAMHIKACIKVRTFMKMSIAKFCYLKNKYFMDDLIAMIIDYG